MRPNALARTRVGAGIPGGAKYDADSGTFKSKPLSEEEKEDFTGALKGGAVGVIVGTAILVLGILWMKDAP